MSTIFIRAILLYAFIVIAMRVMGKRQLGELEASELAVTIMISELASIPIQDTGIPLLHAIIPIFSLIGLEFLMSFGTLKSIRFRAFVCGRPSVVIENGKINQMEMKRNRITLDELISELRQKNVLDLASVKYGIMESGGQLSAILYEDENPATPKQMSLNLGADKGMPLIVVSDGRYMDKNLIKRGLSRKWVEKWLNEHGKLPVNETFLMSIDDSGRVYYAAKEKNPA